jgi:hypothetical protein
LIHETFFSLLKDPAHWEFEIFLMFLFDGLIFGLLFPFIRVHWRHHVDRDRRDAGEPIGKGPDIGLIQLDSEARRLFDKSLIEKSKKPRKRKRNAKNTNS